MNEAQKTAVTWGIVSIALSIFMITFNNSPMVLGAGFFAKFIAFIVSTILGLIGATLGDAIRKFAIPDSIYSTGGMTSAIKTKLFWMIGPQSIGVFIGVALGISIVLK